MPEAEDATNSVVPVLTLSPSDTGATHDIKVGDVVAVVLPDDSASTGYSWQLQWASGGFVETQPAVQQRPAGGGAGGRVGGTGTITYYLQVGEPGMHPLTGIRKQWFSERQPAADSFLLLLNTAPAD